MAYSVPSLLINQEFTQIPVFTQSPLSALIIGPFEPPVGYIKSIAVGSDGGGTGYVNPIVTVTDTNGSGATATATVASGVITAINVTAGGIGYTSGATVTVTDVGGGSGFAAGTVVVATTRAAYTQYVGTIGSVNSVADVIRLFGDISVSNPIAYGCLQALNNSNSATVYYAVVGTGSEETAYLNALTLAQKSNNYYGIVPLTYTSSVHNDVAAHVNAMSAPAQAKWRTAWICTNISSPTGSDSEVTTYNAAILASGENGISSANPNSGLRRIHNVFPPTYTDGNGNTGVPGYFLAAALAGLRSGSVPHQSLTNTQVIGPASVPLCTSTYSESQLDTIAGAGSWIVTQSINGGVCYTRHQLTGDNSNLNFREDSVTANVDSISYGLQSALAPFVGIYNINPGVLLQIRTVIDGELSFRLTGTYTARAGNQLISYNITSIAQDAVFADRLNIVVQLQVPYPMNYITVTLTV